MGWVCSVSTALVMSVLVLQAASVGSTFLMVRNLTSNSVELEWSRTLDLQTFDRYVLWWSLDGGVIFQIRAWFTDPSTTHYTVGDLFEGRTYQFYVSESTKDRGELLPSNTVVVTPPLDQPSPSIEPLILGAAAGGAFALLFIAFPAVTRRGLTALSVLVGRKRGKA